MGKHRVSGKNSYEAEMREVENSGRALLRKKYVPLLNPKLPRVKKV